MKYDMKQDDIDLNTTSQGKILSQITPRSTVLECGCATGYMTRYMKEKLHCDVYIVEYDQEAFEIAKQYAKDGVACDLMTDEWTETLADIQFDYILFADVLEHLYDPLAVVQRAKQLLKYDGKIIVSLPNVGHNDIILKLLSGCWKYTATGLLDETHIRFWGIYDLEPFFQNAGLGITIFDSLNRPSFHTEQYIEEDTIDILKYERIISHIDHRREGEIYQFILTLQKIEYIKAKHVTTVGRLPAQNTKAASFSIASVYFDYGSGFDEKQVKKYSLPKSGRLDIEIDVPEAVTMLRFDPTENLFCALKNICIQSTRDTVPLTIEMVDPYTCGEYTFFFTSDPQILISLPQTHGDFALTISAEIIPLSLSTMNVIRNAFLAKDQLIFQKQITHDQRLQEVKEMLENERENMARSAVELRLVEQELHTLQSELEIYKQQSVNVLEVLAAEQKNVQKLIEDNSNLRTQLQQLNEQYIHKQCKEQELLEENVSLHKEADLLSKRNTVLEKQATENREYVNKMELQVAETLHQRCELENCKNVLESNLSNIQTRLDVQTAYNEEIRQANERLLNAYNIVINSDCWRITAPLRRTLDKIKFAAQKNQYASLSLRGLQFLKRNGLQATIQKACQHFNKQKIRLVNAEAIYEQNIDFKGFKTDIKPLALYLPQFHEIKENNEWWGKGFTEWTNVKKGRSRFENHNQPRIPDSSLGYYDLSDVETLKKQIKLAKQHGIYGFAIYYYWFSGKRLLEKPMDILLKHKEINFPFMAVWANENWTRTWDGMENSVLIEQKYNQDDPRQFILDLKKYIDDSRYIRVEGKPVIGLYAPYAIPDVKMVLEKWRKTASEIGIGDIQIWVCAGDSNAQIMGVEAFVDAEYEFPPRGKGYVSHCAVPSKGTAYNYQELVENERAFDVTNRKIPIYRGSMMQWDNSARKEMNYHCWINYTPELFYLWNKTEVADMRRRLPEDQRFLFINAWNEWGEGTYLEPDQKYGYASINALSKAIFDLPYEYAGIKKNDRNALKTVRDETESLQRRAPVHYVGGGLSWQVQKNWDHQLKTQNQIAVQAHIFYTDLAPEITAQTNHIPFPFDLYVSTDSEEKASDLRLYFEKNSNAKAVHVEVMPNKGRDVVPFLKQLSPVIREYKYFCHIHSKKSLHNESGNIWRKYLYENLLGSEAIVSEIMHLFETDESLGVIFPENMDVLRPFVEWGSNKEIARSLLERMNIHLALPDDILFPAGNMFWGRVSAVQDVFQIDFQDSDFPEEGDQVDGTTMHAIERLWLLVAAANGMTYQETRSVFDNRPLLS